jgi:serine protein kinase
MRSIEEKIDIPESRKDDFRREIMNYIGALAIEGKTFDYKRRTSGCTRRSSSSSSRTRRTAIKLTSLVSTVVDKETQEKIDVVKSAPDPRTSATTRFRATDVLNYVASIFARGDAKAEQ